MRGFSDAYTGYFDCDISLNLGVTVSALNEINVQSITAIAPAGGVYSDATNSVGVVIPPAIEAAVKKEIGALFWSWYHQNADRKIAHVHIWLFSHDLTVRELQSAFVLLFGDDPTVAAGIPDPNDK